MSHSSCSPPTRRLTPRRPSPAKSAHLELHGTAVSARPGIFSRSNPLIQLRQLALLRAKPPIAHRAVCVRACVRCQVITIKILLNGSFPWREGTSWEIPELGAHGGRASRCHCPPVLYRAAVAISPWTSWAASSWLTLCALLVPHRLLWASS